MRKLFVCLSLCLALGLTLTALPAAADHEAFFQSLDGPPTTDIAPTEEAVQPASLGDLGGNEPIFLSSPLCEPMPPLCEAVNKQQEYCDCVAAGGNSGFCRCRWCLGESIEMCKVTRPVP